MCVVFVPLNFHHASAGHTIRRQIPKMVEFGPTPIRRQIPKMEAIECVNTFQNLDRVARHDSAYTTLSPYVSTY